MYCWLTGVEGQQWTTVSLPPTSRLWGPMSTGFWSETRFHWTKFTSLVKDSVHTLLQKRGNLPKGRSTELQVKPQMHAICNVEQLWNISLIKNLKGVVEKWNHKNTQIYTNQNFMHRTRQININRRWIAYTEKQPKYWSKKKKIHTETCNVQQFANWQF